VWRGLALSDDDCVRAAVIGQLMCQGVIDTRAIEERFGIDFAVYFGEALARLKSHIADGLVGIGEGRITVTSAGRFLLRSIAMCFDAYLKVAPPADAPRPSFSRVV
jgi:oxygen-independent coproporphyrinogen-3 oxidase